jgi:hypothetical protein
MQKHGSSAQRAMLTHLISFARCEIAIRHELLAIDPGTNLLQHKQWDTKASGWMMISHYGLEVCELPEVRQNQLRPPSGLETKEKICPRGSSDEADNGWVMRAGDNQ